MLHGLNRVRGFTQDDAHLFCTPDQLQHEFEQTLDEALRLMKAFGFADFSTCSRRGSRRGRGETDAIAEQAIRKAFESYELPYTVDEGGGAFYGPKLDINVRDALGRPWQLGTVQVDFVLPDRFDLKYRGRRRPRSSPRHDSPRACRARSNASSACSSSTTAAPSPLGWRRSRPSLRRYPRTNRGMRARSWRRLQKAGFRAELDESNEKLGYKIRHWKTQKVPYILVVGQARG